MNKNKNFYYEVKAIQYIKDIMRREIKNENASNG